MARNSDTVTAAGNVVLRRQEQSLKADKVTWNRKSGEIVATGNIRLVDQDGNQLFTDRVELTDELKTGAMENMLLAMREGGRLAAKGGKRLENGHILLDHAAYTACEVEDGKGCAKSPSWRITAREVVYEPDTRTVRFRGARMELFGIRFLPLPGLALATDGRAISGPLIPDFRFTPSNGLEVSEAYYQRLVGQSRHRRDRLYLHPRRADGLGPVPGADQARRLPDHRLHHQFAAHSDRGRGGNRHRARFSRLCLRQWPVSARPRSGA